MQPGLTKEIFKKSLEKNRFSQNRLRDLSFCQKCQNSPFCEPMLHLLKLDLIFFCLWHDPDNGKLKNLVYPDFSFLKLCYTLFHRFVSIFGKLKNINF